MKLLIMQFSHHPILCNLDMSHTTNKIKAMVLEIKKFNAQPGKSAKNVHIQYICLCV
jgi:hypothetical protein